MFGDIGWAELMIIAVVALIVIGPKDLPEMFRQLGRITAKIRAMARDFSRAMEQAAKESGMADAAKDMKAATSPAAMGMDKVRAAADKFEKWDPLKPARAETKPLTPPPMPPAAGAASVAAPTSAPAVAVATEAATQPEPNASKPARKPKAAAPQASSPETALAKATVAAKSPRKKAETK